MTLQALSYVGHVADVDCEHCGGQRMVMTVTELRSALHAEPTPLLARAVYQLRQLYGARAPLFVCSACSCITADSRDHAH